MERALKYITASGVFIDVVSLFFAGYDPGSLFPVACFCFFAALRLSSSFLVSSHQVVPRVSIPSFLHLHYLGCCSGPLPCPRDLFPFDVVYESGLVEC